MRHLLESTRRNIVLIIQLYPPRPSILRLNSTFSRNPVNKVNKYFEQVRYKSKAQGFVEDLYKRMASSTKPSIPIADQKTEESSLNSKTPELEKTHEKTTNKNRNRRKKNQVPLSEYLESQDTHSSQSKIAQTQTKEQSHRTRTNSDAVSSEGKGNHNSNSKRSGTPSKSKPRHPQNKKVSKETADKNIPNFLLSPQSVNKKSMANGTGKDMEDIEQEIEQDSTEGARKKNHNKQQYNRKNKLPEVKFEEYMKFDDCVEGLKLGELMKGCLRINVRNFNEAYLTSEEGGRDIYIDGVASRNRALPGDIVVIKMLPKEEWKIRSQNANEEVQDDSRVEVDDNDIIRTAKVVFIFEKKHTRVAAGFLNIYKNNAFGFALMSPVDNRLPRLMIPLNDCPEQFKTRPKDFDKTLFVAHISNWSLNMAFASGKLMQSLGEAGHIEPETEALLISNDIDSSPFRQDVLACLPDDKEWGISQEELKKRLDLREECIFSIDPATARDLDDALSCKKIDDDLFEVGVHIADVSHFIEQGNALDKVAMQRATSVYLAQRVIPMLPSVLCEKLCSLNPGVDRLAYSVIWNLRSDGTVVKEWFGRTVIRSCSKLSYDHAQQLIESNDNDELDCEQFPNIHGGFSLVKVQQIVKVLHGISVHLRKRRFDSGALRLDQPKLSYTLDKTSGLPNGFGVYDYKDSNRLIEEFMLLANMAVGHKIYKEHPDRAILRCHPPPHPVMMDDVNKVCKQNNIPFDISDSASISRSLEAILQLEPEVRQTLGPALTLLCTKPFQNAKYFCTGSLDNEAAYRHYALNVPIYTHFTSPIRRYPDVLVHRFLTAALDKSYEIHGQVKELQAIAELCNDKKWAAKKASEQSSMLFFAVYLLECGPMCEKGVVVGVLDKAVDVLCTRLGMVQRVYCDKLSLYKHAFKMVDLKQELTLYWQDDTNKTMDEKIEAITRRFERNWQGQKAIGSNSKQEESIPSDAIEQKLTMFSPVEVILSVDRNTPTKVTTLLKSPFITDTPSLNL